MMPGENGKPEEKNRESGTVQVRQNYQFLPLNLIWIDRIENLYMTFLVVEFGLVFSLPL